MIFHYEETPEPVGLPMGMNASTTSYALGINDGALHAEQYADEPEAGVLFESPQAAKEWLAAATKALTPYITSGNREPQIPNPDGWDEWEEED